jgi:hypothetical protein
MGGPIAQQTARLGAAAIGIADLLRAIVQVDCLTLEPDDIFQSAEQLIDSHKLLVRTDVDHLKQPALAYSPVGN